MTGMIRMRVMLGIPELNVIPNILCTHITVITEIHRMTGILGMPGMSRMRGIY